MLRFTNLSEDGTRKMSDTLPILRTQGATTGDELLKGYAPPAFQLTEPGPGAPGVYTAIVIKELIAQMERRETENNNEEIGMSIGEILSAANARAKRGILLTEPQVRNTVHYLAKRGILTRVDPTIKRGGKWGIAKDVEAVPMYAHGGMRIKPKQAAQSATAY